MPYIILFLYMAVAVALQILVGSFPVSLFSFPLNISVFLIWISGMAIIWKSCRKSSFIRFMITPNATFVAIGLLLTAVIVIGFTGNRTIVTTWPFVFILLYFQTVLLFVILRGWRMPTATGARLGAVRWRFLILHAGLLLTVGFAFWGAPDSDTWRLKAYPGTSVSEAYDAEGQIVILDYSITLIDFEVEYDNQGMPTDYEACLCVDDDVVSLRVNHPVSVNFAEDLYLSGFDASGDGSCTLMIVSEPWKYGVTVGIIMMLLGALLLFAGGPAKRFNAVD